MRVISNLISFKIYCQSIFEDKVTFLQGILKKIDRAQDFNLQNGMFFSMVAQKILYD